MTQFGLSFKRLGWSCHFVDPTEPDNFRKAITAKTKAIFLEVLANPGGLIIDLEKVVEIGKNHGIPVIVDNTMASPYLLNPIDWGADIVIHSTTKFLNGHGTSMGGVIIESGKFDWVKNGKFPSMTEPDPAYHGLIFHETFGDFGLSLIHI